MSRISDKLIEIEDYIMSGMDDVEIAKLCQVPLSWVEQSRQEMDNHYDMMAYACNSYDCPAMDSMFLDDDGIPY